jgi:hypothetical protein
MDGVSGSVRLRCSASLWSGRCVSHRRAIGCEHPPRSARRFGGQPFEGEAWPAPVRIPLSVGACRSAALRETSLGRIT